MAQHLQREIDGLKKSILSVGTLVEEALRKSVRAFSERDPEMAQEVIDNDKVIDQLEVELEEDCLKILALHQPVAIDLRFIISVLKINNDLERIGDLASNIASRAEFLAKKPPLNVPEPLPQMTTLVQRMTKKSLDALVEMDLELAIQVCKTDDEVDNLNSQMYKIVQANIEADISRTAEWIQLLGVSRSLERAADHTTNIAEDIIYMVEGKIHRHGSTLTEHD